MTDAVSLQCLWSDGRHSRVLPGRMRLAADGALEVDAGEAGGDSWPREGVRLSPRLGSMPRVLRLPDGGSIEVADSPLLEQWFGQPSRIEAAADWLERRRSAIIASAALILAGSAAFILFGVPWLANEVAVRIPPSVERAVSNQAVALIDRMGLEPSTLPEARQRAIERKFDAMVAGEPRAEQMELVIVHLKVLGPNAFALPDGRIYLTDALVELAGDDREVLAVLAHEAGHHVYRHGMRNALEHSSVFLLAGLLLGDASGSSMTVALPTALLNSRFSRGHEAEADRYAIGLLERRGESPQAFADILRKLSEATESAGLEQGPAGYVASHPPTVERIRYAEAAAAADGVRDGG